MDPLLQPRPMNVTAADTMTPTRDESVGAAASLTNIVATEPTPVNWDAVRAAEVERQAQIDEIVEFMRSCPFFTSASPTVLHSLAAVARTYTTSRNEVVIQQGAECDDGIFIVQHGTFRVIRELPIYANAKPPRRNKATLDSAPYGNSIHDEGGEHKESNNVTPRRSLRHRNQREAQPPSATSSITSLHRHTFLTGQHNRSVASMKKLHKDGQQVEPARNRSKRTTKSSSVLDEDSNGASAIHPRPPPASSTSTLPSLPTTAAPAPTLTPRRILIGSRFLNVNTIQPHGVFGEIGVMNVTTNDGIGGGRRSASVVSESGHGRIIVISAYDFLRLASKPLLQSTREMAGSYRSDVELWRELDDTRQWDQYKKQLLYLSADKSFYAGKVDLMPVFESVPVDPFQLRLPRLPTLTTSSTSLSASDRTHFHTRSQPYVDVRESKLSITRHSGVSLPNTSRSYASAPPLHTLLDATSVHPAEQPSSSRHVRLKHRHS